MSNTLGEIEIQILWNRLLSVVEEQAQTLVRTAFSTAAREAGDISAGVFDMKGRMLAQAVTGTPGHINSMARSVVHFLDAFPASTLKDGDILITNDPWKGTGHLFDLTVVTPIFLDGRAVALFAWTTHVVDIGGLGVSAEGRQIYHEGLYIPLMYLARAGQMNDDLLGMVRANVREPIQVVGDIYALIACNEKGGTRLVEMMREFSLRDLELLGEEIITRSRRAMAEVIAKLPQGSWSASMTIDGYEAPVTLAAKLTIAGDRVLVDYTGTSGLSRYAINCPICYTDAYTAFGVKAALAPWIPNDRSQVKKIRRRETTLVLTRVCPYLRYGGKRLDPITGPSDDSISCTLYLPAFRPPQNSHVLAGVHAFIAGFTLCRMLAPDNACCSEHCTFGL